MTFDEWWKGNMITPEMTGSLEAWARVVWNAARAVNIRDHGALGVGRTDDTEALHSAFRECTARGCELFIPPGRYVIKRKSWWNRLLSKIYTR